MPLRRCTARPARRLPALRAQASYLRLSSNIPEAEFTLPGLDTTFTLLPVPLDRYHTELRIEQPIFTGFRLLHETRAAGLEADAAAFSAEQRPWSGRSNRRSFTDVSSLGVEEQRVPVIVDISTPPAQWAASLGSGYRVLARFVIATQIVSGVEAGEIVIVHPERGIEDGTRVDT